MSFLVSPGVQVNELDLTNVVPATSTSIGGYAGSFNWGPVEEIRTVSSEKELALTYGTPDATTFRSFLTAASFLLYGNNLKVVRSAGTTAKNASTGQAGSGAPPAGVLIKNRSMYETDFETGQGTAGAFAAKYPGELGNGLGVSVCAASSVAFAAWQYKSLFAVAPDTSTFGMSAGSSNDELHVVVYDNTGVWTGTAGKVLETFGFVSQAKDAVKTDGTTNYYANVLNANSKYVWWMDHPALLTDAGRSAYENLSFTSPSAAIDYTFSGGVDDLGVDGDVQTALALLADAETVDVNLLFTSGDATGYTIANSLVTIAQNRKDCVAFISPPISASVGTATPAADVIAWAADVTSSSYAVIDSGALKVYDKYNDVYRFIPACGHIAGLCANTDRVADAWFSPAGYNRGSLLNVTKLAYNPSQADRDALYLARVNPIVSFPGQGVLLFGDKTAQAKPSAFDRINVRRLFNVLEKSISTAAKYQLFEFNDAFTQATFRNLVEPFLRTVKGRRGITDFKVVCDSTNNTGEVVDRNEFRADIYIKPAHAINYITLNFIATRTSVSFTEVAGQ